MQPLPDRALSDQEVEVQMGRIIDAYGVCKGRLDAVLRVE